MALFKSFTKEKLVKWQHIQPNVEKRICQRLAQIMKVQPLGVPALLSFGWSSTNGLLRLEIERVPGIRLFDLHFPIPLNIIQLLEGALVSWQSIGFIHGDLSPRNILVDIDAKQVWFVDWVLDLSGFKGTPKYASKEVFLGKRSFESDQFALEHVLKNHI